MGRTRGTYKVWACGLAAAAVLVASAESRADSRIVNGVTSHAFPTTGALLYHSGGNPGSAGIICSGTLIGCNTFLTASHCVVEDGNPARYFVFLQHAGVFPVTSLSPHSDYRSNTFPIADVAVVELGSTVLGIDPTTLNLTDPEPFIPQDGVIAGFGQTLGAAGDYGIKRAGAIETVSCNSSLLPQNVGNDEVVCWSYSAPIGPPGDDSNTCNGDSGGPLFLDLGSGETVAGVTSGGTNGTCSSVDHSYDANVFTYSDFIVDRLGGDSTAACGSIPAVGTGGTSVVGEDGSLSVGNTSDTYSVTLSSHVNVLRFVLNGEDNGSLDADLYVRRGSPPTTSVFDCKSDGAGNFGACNFELPITDTWHVLVQRASGTGDYQLTTTIFGGSAPVCGNGDTETGEECDGADDGACDGLCNLGTCQCPPPSCGNDVTESGEECDGTSTAECPTPSCEPDCTCTGTCGDGVCGGGETASGCSQDCGCSAVSACAFGQAPAGCYCDDACDSFGDCCPDACIVCEVCEAGCGNGLVELGEDCDDGNTSNGDCCSSTCTADPFGTACDDGTLCTGTQQCDGAGTCVGTPSIAGPCFDAGKTTFRIDDVPDGNKDKLKWMWLKGEAFGAPDVGNPSTSTVYELCVFDMDGGVPSLATSARPIASSSLWTEKPGKSWSYTNPVATGQGIHKLSLHYGAAGQTKVKLKAKGTLLDLPGAVGSTYFDQDPSVVVQVRNSLGECWTAEYGVATVSVATRFSAKTP